MTIAPRLSIPIPGFWASGTGAEPSPPDTLANRAPTRHAHAIPNTRPNPASFELRTSILHSAISTPHSAGASLSAPWVYNATSRLEIENSLVIGHCALVIPNLLGLRFSDFFWSSAFGFRTSILPWSSRPLPPPPPFTNISRLWQLDAGSIPFT